MMGDGASPACTQQADGTPVHTHPRACMNTPWSLPPATSAPPRPRCACLTPTHPPALRSRFKRHVDADVVLASSRGGSHGSSETGIAEDGSLESNLISLSPTLPAAMRRARELHACTGGGTPSQLLRAQPPMDTGGASCQCRQALNAQRCPTLPLLRVSACPFPFLAPPFPTSARPSLPTCPLIPPNLPARVVPIGL